MVTIYDIAKEANVSAMTVSRVINNKGRISEATRIKVRKVMEELGYVPNTVARSLVLQQTHMLSLLIADITNPFYTTLARGAEDAAKRLGYKLLFGNSDESMAKEKDYVDMILSTRVDGVLFAPTGDTSLEHLRLLEKRGIPFVLLDREVPGIKSDIVQGDSKEGARKLIDHLIDLGHTRIALINGSSDTSTARYRYLGYREALKLRDLPFDEALVQEVTYRGLEDEAVLSTLLTLPNPPTAIFAANNLLALGIIKILRGIGLSVPEDISLVCYDDLGFASEMNPFLTVAAQPAYQFGSMGMQLLVERIQGNAGTNPRTLIFPSDIRVRSSSAPPVR
ncbi:LacI family DNA-binding transcriptional regulator [Paenibacillus eucommiae]|uniref:LacI family transcriptional regulator n=1 Tax=Paenibacillus eucommiae TaxID=1355755 RepID=A0ABS4IZ96_9BACL|nr:LacI family DNA-binding transcriptional regulator [Paenibacillus eucommiae]MBP1992912.1 LacI family transcriptional regulator [Paenibacillus eucommiae]